MRGSFEVASSPRFCFLGFLPSRLLLLLLLHLSTLPFSLQPRATHDRLRGSFSFFLLFSFSISPFGIRLFHGGDPSSCLPFLFPSPSLSSCLLIRCNVFRNNCTAALLNSIIRNIREINIFVPLQLFLESGAPFFILVIDTR